MTATFTLVLLALGFGGHRDRGPGCCDVCGVETGAVLAEIQLLKTCPRWRTRDNAAHRLRKFDWRCHPEAAVALVDALLHDCEEEVREEAAQSLRKMAPCVPGVHVALRKAADCDPDHSTRRWARKALQALGRRCVGECAICGPVAAEVVVPAPPSAVIEPAPVPVEPAPPSDLPPPLPDASPFNPSAPPPPAEPPLTTPISERKRPTPALFRLGLGRRSRIGADR